MAGSVRKIASKFDGYFSDLKKELAKLEAKFLAPTFKDPTMSATKYAFEVKAYCILAHAAMEEFVEHTGLLAMQEAIDRHLGMKTRPIHQPLVALLASSSEKVVIDDSETGPERTAFDYLRPALQKIKQTYSKQVHDNHGISKRHLRNLLLPVAINIPDDAQKLNSLSQLWKSRGDYAHNTGVKKLISPSDAKNYVNDCLALCKDICDQAKTKFRKA